MSDRPPRDPSGPPAEDAPDLDPFAADAAAADGDESEITLRDDDDPPPQVDEADEPYDGTTFGLGPVTKTPDRVSSSPLSEPTLPRDNAPPPPRRRASADAAVLPPRRRKPAERPKSTGTADDDDGRPGKPRLRDWLEARCRKEAKMYGLALLAVGPVAAVATLLTWIVLKAAIPGEGWLDGLLAAAAVGGLFWVERVTREGRKIRLRVEPEDRDIQPVSLDLPRGAGLTWLMYLAGSRDRSGFVRFVLGVMLFGPRLCELVFKMARTAKRLWNYDADLMAEPVKTLVKAEGKVSFAAFLEAHKRPAPQELVDRLALIDGVLFLPTSNPPGLCTSGALKDEFAAWRENWREERRAESPLSD